jgi:hypothetical protein
LKKRPSGQGLDMACGNDEMELTEGKCAQLTTFPDSTWVFARQRRPSEFKVEDYVKAQPRKKCALNEVDAQVL